MTGVLLPFCFNSQTWCLRVFGLPPADSGGTLRRSEMKEVKATTAQLVWEILNAALYDLTKGNPNDGIAAIEEAINLLEGESK